MIKPFYDTFRNTIDPHDEYSLEPDPLTGGKSFM